MTDYLLIASAGAPAARRGQACSSTTTQRLVREIGRLSRMNTVSPTLQALASSCAWYFFDRRTVFFITGWVKRRSTLTTTVLSFLSLTTTPLQDALRHGLRP